jgi:hypothetical protein
LLKAVVHLSFPEQPVTAFALTSKDGIVHILYAKDTNEKEFWVRGCESAVTVYWYFFKTHHRPIPLGKSKKESIYSETKFADFHKNPIKDSKN